MDAPTIYAVRVWVDPAYRDRLLAWLRDQHLGDVVAQPGMLWGRCVKLEQDGEDGWPGYLMLYGVESRDALQRYFESPIHAVFAEQRAPFAGALRMDRAWGRTEITEEKAAP